MALGVAWAWPEARDTGSLSAQGQLPDQEGSRALCGVGARGLGATALHPILSPPALGAGASS